MSIRPLAHVKLIDLPGNPDGPRQLTFLENGEGAPFPIRRIYWIHSLGDTELRGQHAHRDSQQLLVAVNGAFRIVLDDGFDRRTFELANAAQALWLPPGLWREVQTLQAGSVLLCLASTHFDEADYIRDYEDFRAFARTRDR